MQANQSPTQQLSIDLLIHAKWIIPVQPSNTVLTMHSLAIQDGKILAILPQEQAKLRYQARAVHSLDHHAVLPGLVNAHGHAAMSLMRGIADDLPLHTWLQDFIWPLEGRWVSEEFVQHGAQLAIAEMLRGGTTCFADMYFFPDVTGRVAMNAHIRAQLAAPVIDFPTPWAKDADECINKANALHDLYNNSSLISTAFGPHAPYTVPDAALRKIAILTEELDIPVHMHVHETAQEILDSEKMHGKRPLQRLEELGLLSPHLLCVHATQLLDDEIRMLADTAANVVHCPESNLKLASGFCPVHRLLEAGINVAMGTDGAASNNDVDMFSELRTTALLAKAVAGDASAVPAHQALQMATLNGARALGLDHLTGSLEVGKMADICAVRLDALNTSPVYHPISHLAYSTQASQVSHVWVGGKNVVYEGELKTINTQALREQTIQWQDRLSSGLQNEAAT